MTGVRGERGLGLAPISRAIPRPLHWLAIGGSRATGGWLVIACGLAILVIGAGKEPAPSGSRTARILYTAGTAGYLEPIEREGEVRGGLARRAAYLAATRGERSDEREKASGRDAAAPAVIFEAGGLFDPSFPQEGRRARLLVTCMADMGYDVVHLSASDLALGRDSLAAAFAGSKLTLLSTNARPETGSWPAVRSARRRVGGIELVVLGVVPPAAAPPGFVITDPAVEISKELARIGGGDGRRGGDPSRRGAKGRPHVVVLSDLSPTDNEALVRAEPAIEVIISTRARAVENLGHATIFPRTDGGTSLGVMRLGDGGTEGALAGLGLDAREDPAIRERLTEYYRAVASSTPQPEPLRASEGTLRYVGARICAQCHGAIYESWLATPHSHAYETLVEARRHELPDCVICHATGVGHPTGFTTDRTRPYFAGVQCESCHGAGSAHSRLPARGTIRRQVSDAVCLDCHTASQSPGYHARPADYRARVMHRETPVVAAASAAPRAQRANIELTIMSLCPFGGMAARDIAALRDSLKGEIDVRVHYIVRATATGTTDPGNPATLALISDPSATEGASTRLSLRPGPGQTEACVDNDPAASDHSQGDALTAGFSSLHGPEEVLEDLRQIVIAERYPDRILDYIAGRAADEGADWRTVAAPLGIDAAKVEVGLGPARAHLLADAERARALGIVASPTVHLNGVAVADFAGGGRALERAICAAIIDPPADCASLPSCDRNSDCRSPGKEGRCLDPGRPHARCAFSPAPRVVLHVINDPSCGLCSPIDVVAGARDLFPNLEVAAHDVTTGGGREWVDAFDIQSVPAFAFVGAESSAAFSTLRPLLIPGKGGSLLDPAALRGPLYFRREARPRTVDIFVDATGPQTLLFLRSLAEIAHSAESRVAFDSASVVVHPVVETGPPAAPGALLLVQRGNEAVWVPESSLPRLRSRLGAEDLAEARRQACIAQLGGRRILDYMLDRAASGEAGVGDWRERCRRLGLDVTEISRCSGGGGGDARLEADRRFADSLGIRAPAALAGNRLRFDGLGPWNSGAFLRALSEAQSSPAAAP